MEDKSCIFYAPYFNILRALSSMMGILCITRMIVYYYLLLLLLLYLIKVYQKLVYMLQWEKRQLNLALGPGSALPR